MVNPLTTLSIVSLYVETLLIAYMAAQMNTDGQMVFFIAFILLIIISYVLTTTSSSFMVRTSMDFSGRYPGKVVCFALHLCQLSLAWRFGKLFFLYDRKDWFELTSLRLIHIAIQTLPFLAIQGYITFSTMTSNAVSVLALSIALMSASISLTLFCAREHLHSCSWREVNDVPSNNAKRYCGVFMLLLGTTLALCARFACIVLMSLVVSYFVFIPIVLHMIILIFGYMSCKAVKSKSLALKDVLVRIGLSYLNIFDLVERDIQKVQCKYVSFYTVILAENIVMVAVWLLNSSVEYTTKLIVIVTILALFICALVLKFASCGFITTPANAQLIQSETPDNATITEGKNIIKALSQIPSISSSVPHVLNNGALNGTIPEHSGAGGFTTDEPSGISTSRIRSEGEGRGVKFGSKVRHTVSTDPRGSDSATDNGTYRTGTGTQDSYSIDDPTHVSRYASRDSSLVQGRQTGAFRKCNKLTVIGSNHRARERSEVSLDICSSNSRNTNTLMTSVVETSQMSGAQTSNVKLNNSKDKKIIFPLGNISSKWQKINLRLPSVSNFLVRSHEKKFKPYDGCDNVVTSGNGQWTDSDTLSMVTNPLENNLHTKTCGKTTTTSHVNETDGITARVGPSSVKDTHTLRGQQLTKKDRVQLWLADIKRSKPVPTCQCSSESHSSDCTYVPPPNIKFQDVPKFEDFLADVPPHPEESFVVSSNQTIDVDTPSKQRNKLKSSTQHPDPQHDQLPESQYTKHPNTEPPTKQRRKPDVSPSKEKHGHGTKHSKEWHNFEPSPSPSPKTHQSASNDQRHKPTTSLSQGRPDLEIQSSPSRPRSTKYERSFQDSTAMFESETPRSKGNQLPKQSHEDNDPIVPFFIKLGAMESLV